MVATIKKTVPLAVDETQVSNGAKDIVEAGMPYQAHITVIGVVPILLHGWNVQAVDEKGKGAKGSTIKKTDDLESYVYRDSDGNIGLPGTYLTAALVNAGRYIQDPRSPRKSGMDLVKAGVIALSPIAPFEPATAKWDYEDARRAVVQRSGITRVRPAMREGWSCTFDVFINIPEYITPSILAKLLSDAGRLVGLGDMRPTYGRFAVSRMLIEAL